MKPNLFPALHYKDGHAAIDWLVRTFGFEKHGVFDGADGTVAHAELRFGPGALAIGSGQATAANPWSRVRHGIYACVNEVDALHDRAKAAGAEIASPLKDQDYGSREFSARDLEGHLWGFGTYDMAASEGEPNMFVGLHYRHSRAALAWLERAFGFAKTFEVPGPDGAVMHAEMRLGAGAIMLDSGPKDEWGANDQIVHVYLADPDAHYARAKDAGAHIIRSLHDTPWGSRGYYAQDPEGFLWGFSTYKPAGVSASSSVV